MPDQDTVIRAADDNAIAEAGALIREGRLVAFPTETVYGLGADATSDAAVAAIFDAKQRPRFNPLIVHFLSLDDLAPHVDLNPLARKLSGAFWPGPLTLVLARNPGSPISRLVSAGLDTIAVRLPANPVARKLIAAAGCPLAAPSANRFGDISPTTAAHVAQSLGNAPALILDGGATSVGIESTVVDLSEPRAALLRPGSITQSMIEAEIGALVRPEDGPTGGPEKSPGRIARHYAPRHPLRINATEAHLGEVLLAFGPNVPKGAAHTLNLSPAADLTEAAANLFAMLRELDTVATGGIAAMKIPQTGLGIAINDRLQRAAEPLPKPTKQD